MSNINRKSGSSTFKDGSSKFTWKISETPDGFVATCKEQPELKASASTAELAMARGQVALKTAIDKDELA